MGGLSDFSRDLRLAEQGESRNGSAEIPIMRDFLDAVRSAAKEGALEALTELRKAEAETNSSSATHLDGAQTRGCGWWKALRNIIIKNN